MHTHTRAHTHTHTHTKDGHSRRVTKMEIIYVQLLYHHGLTGASEDMGLMIVLSGSQSHQYTRTHTHTHTHIVVHAVFQSHHKHTKTAPSHSYLTLCVLHWVYYDRLSGGEGIKLLSRHQRQSNV